MSVPNYPKATANLFLNVGLNSLVSNLRGVSKPYKSTNGLTVAACCPCHDDSTPSLFVTEKNTGTPLIYCHGCGASGLDVAEAVGIDWSAVVGHDKKHVLHSKTGHSLAALVGQAQLVIFQAFLILSSPEFQAELLGLPSETRLQLAQAAGKLENLSIELRRADK